MFINPYRYGFNGKENDKETYGNGNEQNYGARMYDTRLGRWLGIDRLAHKYPDMSPYSSVLNDPIYFKDSNGRLIVDKDGRPIYTVDPNLADIDSEQKGVSIKAEVRYYYSNDGKKIKVLVPKYKFVVENELVRKSVLTPDHLFIEADVPVPKEKEIGGVSENEQYDCFGYVIITQRKDGEKVIIQSKTHLKRDSNMKNSIKNPAEYEFVSDNVSGAKEGDIAIFGDEFGIKHASVLNEGKETYTSKNGNDPINYSTTQQEQEKKYGKLQGFYRKKADKPTNIQSENGKVTEEQAKEAIHQ